MYQRNKDQQAQFTRNGTEPIICNRSINLIPLEKSTNKHIQQTKYRIFLVGLNRNAMNFQKKLMKNKRENEIDRKRFPR